MITENSSIDSCRYETRCVLSNAIWLVWFFCYNYYSKKYLSFLIFLKKFSLFNFNAILYFLDEDKYTGKDEKDKWKKSFNITNEKYQLFFVKIYRHTFVIVVMFNGILFLARISTGYLHVSLSIDLYYCRIQTPSKDSSMV